MSMAKREYHDVNCNQDPNPTACPCDPASWAEQAERIHESTQLHSQYLGSVPPYLPYGDDTSDETWSLRHQFLDKDFIQYKTDIGSSRAQPKPVNARLPKNSGLRRHNPSLNRAQEG